MDLAEIRGGVFEASQGGDWLPLARALLQREIRGDVAPLYLLDHLPSDHPLAGICRGALEMSWKPHVELLKIAERAARPEFEVAAYRGRLTLKAPTWLLQWKPGLRADTQERSDRKLKGRGWWGSRAALTRAQVDALGDLNHETGGLLAADLSWGTICPWEFRGQFRDDLGVDLAARGRW